MPANRRPCAVRRRSSQERASRRRWRLWACLALALGLPAAFTSVARADTETLSNPNPIAIPGTGSQGVANPYPSIIRLSGFVGQITDVNVGFENLSHSGPSDIDAVLVGPAGQNVMLMSDAGGNDDINVDLTFDDQAANTLPSSNRILSGTYRPTNIGRPGTFDPPGLADNFPAPGPGGPPHGANLALFNGTSPNGDWRLFVVDDTGFDVGTMDRGWSLTITTPAVENPQGQAVTGPGQLTLRPGACSNPQKGSRDDDVMNGTRAGDRLRGLAGDDLLRGRSGRDCLAGDSGADSLSGGSGNDRLSGGSGRDRLTGGSGRNRYSGGPGNDRINSRNGRRETVNCGSGTDRARTDRFDRRRGCERG
jgi:Ca2+-binding RTX toxin-like protein